MNISKLLAEMGGQRISIPQLADKIGISKKTLYSRIKCATEFTQGEIKSIAEALLLSDEKILEIFFDRKVS